MTLKLKNTGSVTKVNFNEAITALWKAVMGVPGSTDRDIIGLWSAERIVRNKQKRTERSMK